MLQAVTSCKSRFSCETSLCEQGLVISVKLRPICDDVELFFYLDLDIPKSRSELVKHLSALSCRTIETISLVCKSAVRKEFTTILDLDQLWLKRVEKNLVGELFPYQKIDIYDNIPFSSSYLLIYCLTRFKKKKYLL